jgi:hypothetical protein
MESPVAQRIVSQQYWLVYFPSEYVHVGGMIRLAHIENNLCVVAVSYVLVELGQLRTEAQLKELEQEPGYLADWEYARFPAVAVAAVMLATVAVGIV